MNKKNKRRVYRHRGSIYLWVTDSYIPRDCLGLLGQPLTLLRDRVVSTEAKISPGAKVVASWRGDTWDGDWLWFETQPYLQLGRYQLPPGTLQPQRSGTSYLSCKSTNTGTRISLTTGAWEVCSWGDKCMNLQKGPVPSDRAEGRGESKNTHLELVN